MATQKSTSITNFDSQPFNVVNSRVHGGYVKGIVDTMELTDTANADVAIVAKLPVDATILSLKLAADDLGTAGTIDIGLFKKNADGTYTAVDADAFANNIDVATAAVALTEYRFSVLGIETAMKPAYQLAGLTARPAYEDIYIGLTTDTGTTADGTVTIQVQYME